MTLWRSNYDRRNIVKTPYPDVYRRQPSVMGKAGIAGAFEQPARFTYNEFDRRYGYETRLKAKHLTGTVEKST